MKSMLFILLFTSILFSANFDCKKATTNIEKTICNNPNLNGLDEQLSQQYTQLKNSFSEEDKKILLNNQRVWLKKQKACETSGNIESCLSALYEGRIVFFQELAQNRFVRSNDVLTDYLTQMQWQDEFVVKKGHYDKNSKSSIHTWDEAKQYCENSTLDGKNDWRLPSISELRQAFKIKEHFKYMSDVNYPSSTFGEDYYLDTYKSISFSDYNLLGEDYEADRLSEKYYIRCVRGKILQESGNMTTFEPLSAKNPFHLETSHNDELCYSMENLYNNDIQKSGKVDFHSHPEYNWVDWNKKILFKKENDYTNMKNSFAINHFDINNDGNIETVLFRRKYFNIYGDTSRTLDEVIYFLDNNKIDFESITLNEFFKTKITKTLDTHEKYRIFDPKSSKEEFLNGDYILRPFKFKNQYYLSFFGTIGKEPFDDQSYSDITITKLDSNHTLHDVCHFKRILQDTSKNELDNHVEIFRSSAFAKERLNALKMIVKLARYRKDKSVIYTSCEDGLRDKDEHIRNISINYIEINEKSIPPLLKTVINDSNDINKIRAIFKIGNYFTENGSDPSKYYYVIDEHIELVLKAYDALIELDKKQNPNSYEISREMQNIMSSGMRFCNTKKYKNLDLVYQLFKDKIVPWDKEAYEKCQLEGK